MARTKNTAQKKSVKAVGKAPSKAAKGGRMRHISSGGESEASERSGRSQRSPSPESFSDDDVDDRRRSGEVARRSSPRKASPRRSTGKSKSTVNKSRGSGRNVSSARNSKCSF